MLTKKLWQGIQTR